VNDEERFFGRVKRIDVTETAGFPFGILIIQDTAGERRELRYDRDSTGAIPTLNDYVEITAVGNQIISIQRIDRHVGDLKFRDFDEQQQHIPPSTLGLWIIPIVYFLTTAILLLLSIPIESASIILLFPIAIFVIAGYLVLRPSFALVTIGVHWKRIKLEDVDDVPQGFSRGMASGITGFSAGFILLIVGPSATPGPWDSSLILLNLGAALGFLAMPFSILVLLSSLCWSRD
jgi:hypothetical protein